MWLEKRRDPRTEFWDASKFRCQGNEGELGKEVARNVRGKPKWVWFPGSQMKKVFKEGVEIRERQ